MSNYNQSNSVRLIEWILDQAEKKGLSAAALANLAKVSPSYFSKVKGGKIAEISLEKIAAFATALELEIGEVFEGANVPKPQILAEIVGETKADIALYDKTTTRTTLKFVYADTIPDHAWPVIARNRNFFRDVNIEIEPIRKSVGDYPLSYFKLAQNQNENGGDTIFVMPLATLNTVEKEVTPIAYTHDYQGFTLIGRRPSPINELSDGDSTRPSDFCKIIIDLAAKGVLEEKSVAFIDEHAVQFIKLAWKFASRQKLLRLDDITVTDKNIQPSWPSDSFLEELYDIGNARRDFVVGHAMTLAVALKNESRYKRVFDLAQLETLAARTPYGQGGDCLSEIQALRLPVVLALNTADPTKNEGLVLRLCAVAYRTVEHLLIHLTDNIAEELRRGMKLPKSSINDDDVDARSFGAAWRKSYAFYSFETALKKASKLSTNQIQSTEKTLAQKLGWVFQKMQDLKRLSSEKIKQCETKYGLPGSGAVRVVELYQRARRHFELFNYYDSHQSIEEALSLLRKTKQ